jgi:hypothetical protein
MPMIHAETVKAVQELLQERGIKPKENERLGDYVARGLDIPEAKAQTFLELLHEGRSVEDARQAAGIAAPARHEALLTEIARVVGATLGQLRNVAGRERNP